MVVFEILRNIFLTPLELIFEAIFTVAYEITGREEIAIIILSLVVSTLVLPLYKRAEKIESEQRLKENELSYWVNHIKKNFKGDERYMMLDAYYRENHYNPIYQLKSSLSILLQIPFFMAAYDMLGVRAISRFYNDALFESIYGFSLGEPDGLLRFGSIAINVLPLVMTLVNIMAYYIYSKDLPFKTAIRSYLLAVLFLVLLYNSPSALLLYWTTNNIYSLVKNLLLRNLTPGLQKKKERGKNSVSIRISKWTENYFARGTYKGVFILAAVFMSVLTGLLIPLAYLSASPEEFVNLNDPQNPLKYLLTSFFVSVGFFIMWPGVFYYLANKKTRIVISVMMLCISATSVVNYLFFSSETGTINTTLVFNKTPEYSVSQLVVNCFIVAAVIAICFFSIRFKKTVGIIFVAAIMAVLTISLIDAKKIQDAYTHVSSNLSTYREESAPKIRLSSENDNVVIIMLDRAVSGYIPYVFNENPELAQQFEGFVYYPNTVSFAQNTLKTTSALFGGYEYTPERMDARADESLAEKHDEALRVLPVLFSNQGFCVTLMDLPFVGWTWSGDYSSFEDIGNCYTYHGKVFFSSDTEEYYNAENRRHRNLFMYSLFRCSPLCLQETIYDNGDYLSVEEDIVNVLNLLENYRVLDNLESMTQIDNDYNGGLFIMDNQVTHDVTNISNFDPYTPYEFEEGYYISDGNGEIYMWDPVQAADYECQVLALKELGEYFDYLRANDLYDNTRIIIVSDHGYAVYLFEGLVTEDYEFTAEPWNSLLMVKDFGSTGFVTDYSFMTIADVPTIAMQGIIDNPVNPATGVPINSDLKNGDLYVSYSPTNDMEIWNPDYNTGNTFYYEDDCNWYKIANQNIFDFDNWVKTDNPAKGS